MPPAKQNQSRYHWAQNVVTIGLLKVIKGLWKPLGTTLCSWVNLLSHLRANNNLYGMPLIVRHARALAGQPSMANILV